MDYNISAGFDDYPVTIDSQIVKNCDKNTVQKKVGFKKTYETVGTWNLNNQEIKGYAMSPNIILSPPDFMNKGAGGNSGIYKSTSGLFGFENPVSTVLSSDQ